MARILITVPTWNEELVIADTLAKLTAFAQTKLAEHEVTIEVVDNASTDGTTAIVEKDEGVAGSVTIRLRRLTQKGKGRAIRASWQAHLGDMDVLLFTDADLAADIDAIPHLVDEILAGRAELVCGSRFVAGARVRRSFVRELASRAYRICQQVMLGLPVKDAQCGLKAISATAAYRVLPKCLEDGWLFDTELLAWAKKFGLKIEEMPVSWIEARDERRRSAIHLGQDGLIFLQKLAEIKARILA